MSRERKGNVVSEQPVDPFPSERFNGFCSTLRVQTKDFGLIPFKLLGTQRYILDEIRQGLLDGVSTFVILKPRQIGSSTLFMALNMFWAFEYAGLSGAIVTHTETLRDTFRAMLEVFFANLPKTHKIAYKRHNRTLLILKNTSMFTYLVAGTKETSKGGLGRGGAFNYSHQSEVAFYGKPDDLKNFNSSLSTHYRHRLRIVESTANGFNHFTEMCETAQKSPSQRFIFVGWWRNELYRYEKNHPYFKMYYDGRLSPRMRQGIKDVKDRYDIAIEPEQLAWYRWKLEDDYDGDQSKMDEDYPWVAEDAFQATGSKFFTNQSLTRAMRFARSLAFKPYLYKLTNTWSETSVYNVNDARAELRIWEEAQEGAWYVIGCDPAYGSDEKNDRTVISVFRCYADRAIQVAEFCSPIISTYQCAWVLAHLAGYYRNCKVNLEITGPGTAVFNELLSLQREVAQLAKSRDEPAGAADIRNCLGNMTHYVYRRPDSLAGAMALQWKTYRETKQIAMNTFKDNFELNRFVMCSSPALEEMKSVTIDDGTIEAASGKDDRVMAAALACICWKQQVQPRMQAMGLTYEAAHKPRATGADAAIKRRVLSYLADSKIKIG